MFQWKQEKLLLFDKGTSEVCFLIDYVKNLSCLEVQKKAKLILRPDFRKNGVCSKSVTKTFYQNKFLVSEYIFKLVFYCELSR